MVSGSPLERPLGYVVLCPAEDGGTDQPYSPFATEQFDLAASSGATVPHGISRAVAAALPGLWYTLHLPRRVGVGRSGTSKSSRRTACRRRTPARSADTHAWACDFGRNPLTFLEGRPRKQQPAPRHLEELQETHQPQ